MLQKICERRFILKDLGCYKIEDFKYIDSQKVIYMSTIRISAHLNEKNNGV